MRIKTCNFLRVIILIMFVLILCTACHLPSTEPILEVDYPYCMDISAFEIPSLDTYEMYYWPINDLTPTFSWSYPGDCKPTSFRIQFNKLYGAMASPYRWEDESYRIIDEEIGEDTEWTPETPLEPLTKYQWRVAPVISGVVGDFSRHFNFMTGPVCEEGDLTAPNLDSPEHGAGITFDSIRIGLDWEKPAACIPYGYHVEISEDSDFPPSNTEINTDFFERREIFGLYGTASFFQVPRSDYGFLMEDCTKYYWRVKAAEVIWGEYYPDIEISWTPFSEVRTFSTNFDDACDDEKSRDPEEETATPTLISPTPTLAVITNTPAITNTPWPTITEVPPTPTWTPVPPDTTGPPAPNPISPKNDAVVDCDGTTTLTWSPVSDLSGIQEYRVQLGRSDGQDGWSPAPGSPFVMIPKGSASMNVPVDCGAFYRWRVRGVDGEDNLGTLSEWAYFSVILP